MKLSYLISNTLFTFFVVVCYGQNEKDSTFIDLHSEKPIEIQKQIVQQTDAPTYQLFPTENTWTMLKLNTRNGIVSQLHFTISDNFEGELVINSYSLVMEHEELNGRFTMYPTNNMYNFILLDQINGRAWKVQWNNERNKRFIRRIY